MKAIMFPGQGSQYKGMGGDLFKIYHKETELASNILGYDIEELCLKNPQKTLDSTEFTQPALFVVNAFNYYEIKKKVQQIPDFFLGHSLGEYNALLAAGAFTFETGLKLVQKRGELMAKSSDGAMAAVLGIDIEDLKIILKECDYHDIDIANYNTPKQTVIAGRNDSVLRLLEEFNSKNIKTVKLNVSAPFHSRYMRSAADEFTVFVKKFDFLPLVIPVISNVTGNLYRNEIISDLLTEQIKNSVKWTDSILWMINQGVRDFQEVGGLILGKMVTEIIRSVENITHNKEKKSLSVVRQKIKRTDFRTNYNATNLGNTAFKKEYNIRYAYLVGSMYNGISSKELVAKLGKSYMLGFLGTKGMQPEEIEKNILWIQKELENDEPFGVNIYHETNIVLEERQIEIYIKTKVRSVEASGFFSLTSNLVRYRLLGLRKNINGEIVCENKIIAKISSPEEAELFMNPAPETIVEKLLDEGLITQEQAMLSSYVPMSYDICVECDSGWKTNRKGAGVLLPAIQALKEKTLKKYQYHIQIRVGLAGGIGTPQAAAIAYLMGADFIMTGSINQCTVEAGTNKIVKNLLQKINVQDIGYLTKVDNFLITEQQVLRKGVLFLERFKKLNDLSKLYETLDSIPNSIVKKIEKNYFKKSLQEIHNDYKNGENEVFGLLDCYYNQGIKFSIEGKQVNQDNFLIHTGSSLGAFNQLVEGTHMEIWKHRHVDEIGKYILNEAIKLLQNNINSLLQN